MGAGHPAIERHIGWRRGNTDPAGQPIARAARERPSATAISSHHAEGTDLLSPQARTSYRGINASHLQGEQQHFVGSGVDQDQHISWRDHPFIRRQRVEDAVQVHHGDTPGRIVMR